MPKTVFDKVVAAIRAVRDHKGASRVAIVKYLKAELDCDNLTAIKIALKKGVSRCALRVCARLHEMRTCTCARARVCARVLVYQCVRARVLACRVLACARVCACGYEPHQAGFDWVRVLTCVDMCIAMRVDVRT